MNKRPSCEVIPGKSKAFCFLSPVSYFYNSSKTDGASNKENSNDLFSFPLLVNFLKKLLKLFYLAHSSLFGAPNPNFCSCSGTMGICRYNTKKLDPNDYFHAWKNTHKDIPECCIEPYIHSGYMLSHQSWRYYCKVLWIPNNEAVNVWTHLIPAFYFVFLFCHFAQTIDLLHAWPLLFVTAGAIAITTCSSIAHTFHSRSNYHHCCLYMVDYFGISLYAFSSTTAHFFAGSQISYYTVIGWINLVAFVVIAAIGFYFCSLSQTGRKNSNTRHRQLKLWVNGFGYFYGVVPILCRIATSDEEDEALYYYVCQILCMATSPLLYASDFPQKYWPGKFDILGHSHQIFHVLIAYGCYCDIQATHIDLSSHRWIELRALSDYPGVELATIAVIALSVYCFLVSQYFSQKMKQCFKGEVDALSENTPSLATCQICLDADQKKVQ